MDESTLVKYEMRFEEKYDIQDDVLYNAWSKLKQKVLRHLPNSDREAVMDLDLSNYHAEFVSLISPAVDEVLQYPEPVPRKTSKHGHGASQMPRHLTSDQVIQFLAEKKKKNMEEEMAKADRKAARGSKKRERECKQAEKAAGRGQRGGQRGRCTGQRIRSRGRSAQQGQKKNELQALWNRDRNWMKKLQELEDQSKAKGAAPEDGEGGWVEDRAYW